MRTVAIPGRNRPEGGVLAEHVVRTKIGTFTTKKCTVVIPGRNRPEGGVLAEQPRARDHIVEKVRRDL